MHLNGHQRRNDLALKNAGKGIPRPKLRTQRVGKGTKKAHTIQDPFSAG